MDISWGQIFKGFGFALSASLCIIKIQQIRNKKKQLQSFKDSQIKDFSVLQKMNKEQPVYVKAKLKNQNSNKNITFKCATPISYNQFYLEEPSDLLPISNIRSRQNLFPIFHFDTFKFVDANGNEKPLTGVSKLVGDVFHVERKFQPQNVGLLKDLWGKVCYLIQSFFDLVRKTKFRDKSIMAIPETRSPFLMGPTVGMLYYTIGLLTDTYFILKIKFDNGMHSVSILASSVSSLLKYYERDIGRSKSEGTFFGVLAIIFGYLLYRDIKKSFLWKNVLKTVLKTNRNWLNIENISEDKTCIVCYNNCRNLILFDCKHLIMCWDCWKNLKQQNCPMCKKNISNAKVIYVDDAQ